MSDSEGYAENTTRADGEKETSGKPDPDTPWQSCDSVDCTNHEGLKAVRDPEGNLLDMCPDCRSKWPVEGVSA